MPNSYHRLWNICDKSFDADEAKRYQLSILFSQDGVSFSLAVPQPGKVIRLEAFSFFNQSTASQPVEWRQAVSLLSEIYLQNDWLNLPFASINLYLETRKSTLVPLALAAQETNRNILGFNHPLAEEENVKADQIPSASVIQLFTIQSDLENSIQQITRYNLIHCASSVLIELLVSQFRNLKPDDKVFVHVRPRWFELVYIKDKKLRFFNSFEYRNREDFAYFLLFAMDQLGLNPETTEVALLGEIEKESEVYNIIYRYIRNIGFMPRLTALDFPFVFDDLPKHGYFTILNTSLCAL
jgi:hypothetical protein